MHPLMWMLSWVFSKKKKKKLNSWVKPFFIVFVLSGNTPSFFFSFYAEKEYNFQILVINLSLYNTRFWNPDRTVQSDRENLEPLIFVVLLASRTLLWEKSRDPCELRSDLRVLRTVIRLLLTILTSLWIWNLKKKALNSAPFREHHAAPFKVFTRLQPLLKAEASTTVRCYQTWDRTAIFLFFFSVSLALPICVLPMPLLHFSLRRLLLFLVNEVLFFAVALLPVSLLLTTNISFTVNHFFFLKQVKQLSTTSSSRL